MGQLFIDNVRAIVLNNVSNDKFGVGELATELGLSKSQTLRKIKAATGKSVNQYIREQRLEKAAKLIKKTDNSIAEISYQVGFGSPSYFNKAFSKYYGIAPGEYKAKSISLSELKATQTEAKSRFLFPNTKLVYALIALVLVVGGYFIVNVIYPKNDPLPKSIAVLPFKDLSPEDAQWFSDGVSDNILHSLAQMKDVSVTSFTSSSTYRGSNKQIPQIAKELGVSYVLEGSVTLVDGEIKIITQLIDANDQHVWSKEYYESFDDIINVQNNVAQEVLKQLKLTLQPELQKIVDKFPTKNMEAYQLHMEGRRINQSTKLEDLQKNIVYNKKAIAIDTNFADAYAEAAASYLSLATRSWRRENLENFKQAQFYADKALELNPNSDKANAVKARILIGRNWKESEKYFKKALALNPNDAESHYWYAFYFWTSDKEDRKMALKHATRARQLSPFSSSIATRYVRCLLWNDKYDEADAFLNEFKFQIARGEYMNFKANIIVSKNKDWQAYVDWVLAKIEKEPENANFLNVWLGFAYSAINNKPKAKEYALKAMALDSNEISNCIFVLSKNKFSKETEKLMQTNAFKNLSDRMKNIHYWDHSFYSEDYATALQLINEHSDDYYYFNFTRTYAQIGDLQKLDSIEKISFIQFHDLILEKAITSAILEERDSMYHYLNKLKPSDYRSFLHTNWSPQLEKYRHEERYKILLKKHFVPEENW